MWLRRQRYARELYLEACVCIVQPVASQMLVEMFREAWYALRWEFPELCLGAYPEAKEDWLRVEIPDANEAEEWASRTIITELDFKGGDFETARARLAGTDEPTCLYARFRASSSFLTSSESSPVVNNLHLMIKADHLCMDGIGIRILMSRLLALLSQELDPLRTTSGKLDWSSCVYNLTPPWIDLLEPGEESDGVYFQEAVGNHRRLILEQIVGALS